MNPLFVAHAEDPDGIMARVLKMRHCSLTERNPDQHIFVRYDRMVEAFQEAVARADNYDTIFVADVDVNPRLVKAGGSDFSLLKKLAEHRNVYWYDHHEGTAKYQEKMEELGIKVYYNENHCAALLVDVVAHFAPEHKLRAGVDDLYEEKLVKIAQAHDYKNNFSNHENIKIGNELEKIIAVANESLNYDLLLDLSCALRDEKCFDKGYNLRAEWQQYADDFDRRAPLAFQELDDSVEIIKVGKYNILFGYCPALLSQKKGPFHLSEKYENQAEIFVSLFKPQVRNHIILTNKKSSFPVVSFLQSLGGGGRGNGGGFSFDYDLTTQNYQQVKEILLSQMEKYC